MSPGQQDSRERRDEGGGRRQERAPTHSLLAFWAMTSGHALDSRLSLGRCTSSRPSSPSSRFHVSAGTIKSSYAAQRCSTYGLSNGRQHRPHSKTGLLATPNPPAQDVHSSTASRIIY